MATVADGGPMATPVPPEPDPLEDAAPPLLTGGMGAGAAAGGGV
jgi:hypothetical protein